MTCVKLAMDVPSKPRSQKSSMAASRAASLSKVIGRPLLPLLLFVPSSVITQLERMMAYFMRGLLFCGSLGWSRDAVQR